MKKILVVLALLLLAYLPAPVVADDIEECKVELHNDGFSEQPLEAYLLDCRFVLSAKP